VAPESALDRFLEYGRLLYDKAAGLAIISKGDRPQVFTRHILDSLNPVSLFEAPPVSALDIGSGGGLPGIPLAIAWPGTRVILLESRERKAGFLEQAARALRLSNVMVVCARLEELRLPSGERAGAVFIRALGDLPHVLSEASRFAEEGAPWIYFLGERAPREALGTAAAASGASAAEVVTPAPEVVTGAFGGRLLKGRFRGTSG
jgi:16S rRNA (guanine527-N7)-methyltransferase